MKIQRIKHVTVPVQDQQRALDFYTQKLGFEVTADHAYGDGPRWLELMPPGGETKIVLFTQPGFEDKIGTMLNIVFTASDIDHAYQELLAAGVEFLQPLKKEPWGSSAILKDSEGNSFALTTAD